MGGEGEPERMTQGDRERNLSYLVWWGRGMLIHTHTPVNPRNKILVSALFIFWVDLDERKIQIQLKTFTETNGTHLTC